MVISAVLINQAGQTIHFNRLSPTLALNSVHRVSDITGIFTKDASKNSFPGAHWFSDILSGSLSPALITLPRILLTPLSDCCVNVLIRCMSRLSDITKKISH